MLSPQSIEQYRAMSPKERYQLFLGLLDFSMRMLGHRSKEHQDKVWEGWRKIEENSDRAFFEHLRRVS